MGNIKRKQDHPRDSYPPHNSHNLPGPDRAGPGGGHHSRSLDRADSLDQHTVHHRAPPGPPMGRPMSPDNGGMSPPPYGPGYSAPRDQPFSIYGTTGGVFRGKDNLIVCVCHTFCQIESVKKYFKIGLWRCLYVFRGTTQFIAFNKSTICPKHRLKIDH